MPRVRAFSWNDAPDVEQIAWALPRAGRFWLDGVPEHAEGRWSFLGAEPTEVVERSFEDGDPFALHLSTSGAADGLPVPVPEWVGWIAYDAGWAAAERIGLRSEPEHKRGDVPVVWWGRYKWMVAVDAVADETFVLAHDERAADAVRARLEAGVRDAPFVRTRRPRVEAPELHGARIESALDAIGRGELYQVNLARPYEAPFVGDPLALFTAMRRASPVPLGAFIDTASSSDAPTAVAARTMERFLGWDPGRGRVWTRPIKGTIARSGHDDRAEAERLRADHKERAEHTMIVDLMRNDLSRVAVTGTVEVVDPLSVEPFAGLSHLVSTVQCQARPDTTLESLLEATFPPGSVTGAPKLEAMQHIEALEGRARGIYTGALGYVDRAGGLSLAVAIRTAVVREGVALYFAGGGLVEASHVGRETAETELKARVFTDAIADCSE